MKISEIIEVIIKIKDVQEMQSKEERALIEACNLLDKLPQMEEATTYEPLKN